MVYKRINPLLSIAFCIFIAASCAQSGPRNLESARKKAIYAFEDYLFEDDIDSKYFSGPILVGEDEDSFIFTWACIVPGAENAIVEEYVPKDPKAYEGHVGFKWKGRFPPLGGTRQYSLNEAALQNLFGLPLNDDPETLRLRKVPLTQDQYWDVGNFSAISNQINEYAFCFNCAYPDSLSWPKNTRESSPRNNCNLKALDSLRTHDRYGYEYYYRNFIKFVILGTPGADRKWDFPPAIFDSLYNDRLEHIYTNDDDIIVKLIPKSLGCN
jgi:hypothetical protein